MGIGLKKIYYPFDLGNTGLHNVKQFFFFFASSRIYSEILSILCLQNEDTTQC